jgi:adenosylhomocysteine nucleosidase
VLASSGSIASPHEKQRLADTYGAGLVDMEAATVARLAEANGIPFYCLKAVSDAIDAILPDIGPYLGANGQLRMMPFLAHIALRPGSWPALARLGLHSTAAAKNLAESLYDWLDARGRIRRESGIHATAE